MSRKLIITGLLFITLGIILGATETHYLEKIGVEKLQIKSFSVGVRYLFYNGLGLLALTGVKHKFDFELKNHFRFISLGTILFSGSIFLLVLLPTIGININKFIGPVTPIGGLLMILGWFFILASFIRTSKS